jgi:RNA-directed DNA polymerase
VYAGRTLELAWAKVRSNAGGSGVDRITVDRIAKDCPRGLLDLKEQLRQASCQPLPVKRVWIPKPGTNERRPLGIPAVRGRIVQTALRQVIEPIFEHQFAEHSYGFRPGRGCKDALRRVQALLEEGGTWIVDADLKGYFGYFQHSYNTTFPEVDGYIRGRLRSILRKRAGRRGRGRGNDHHQWSNHYFTKLGLFNLTQAPALACESPR